MGHHRAEPGSSQAPSGTPSPYVGRRAAGPVVEASPVTPYVGRRAARVEAEAPPAAPSPMPTVTPAAPLFVEPAVRRRLDPTAIVDTSSFLLGDLDVTAEIPLPRSQPAGRRRATGHEGARGPLFRGLPSVPVLLGVATLAIAVGGAVTAGGPALAGSSTPTVRQAGALTGSSGVATGGDVRAQAPSRSDARTTLDQATSGQNVAPSSDALQQHDTALTNLAQQAEHQATKLNNNQWVLPITRGVYHLTARFGDVGLWASFHTGLDFACATGTPIHAIGAGIVTFAGYDGAYGNKTVVTLPDGTEIWYGHQTTQYVQVGDTVARGEVIGTVGSTGHVTGPHVHIEVRPGGGDPVDPFPAFVQHGVTP